MDLGMPVMTGLQAARTIAQSHPRLPMLMMSVQEVSTTLAKEARHAGYRGAVTKGSGNEIVRGVEALLWHNTFFYAEDEIGGSRSKSELSHGGQAVRTTNLNCAAHIRTGGFRGTATF